MSRSALDKEIQFRRVVGLIPTGEVAPVVDRVLDGRYRERVRKVRWVDSHAVGILVVVASLVALLGFAATVHWLKGASSARTGASDGIRAELAPSSALPAAGGAR